MKIICATHNKNKIKEIGEIFSSDSSLSKLETLSAGDLGVDLSAIEETGKSFKENALIKATAVHKALENKDIADDYIVMADDSGLVIDALNGEPGIYSARYMGEDTDYSIKNANLIKRVNESGKERTARFVCAIAGVCKSGREFTVEGTVEGEIAYEPKGSNGFGYDPIFYIKEYGCTTAEMPSEKKNEISHRGRALIKMKEELIRSGLL